RHLTSGHPASVHIQSCVERFRLLGCRRRKGMRGMKRDFNNQAGVDERRDVYERVTTRIIADLENGVRPWFQPWKSGDANGRPIRPLRHNGLPYSGVNVLMLWSIALERGYTSATWMTFNQAQELGAHIRKGEKSSLVVYASQATKAEKTEA